MLNELRAIEFVGLDMTSAAPRQIIIEDFLNFSAS
jgi:hypothetical protein